MRLNSDMVKNLFSALGGKPLVHAGLVTGAKYCLGPFESYGQIDAEMPSREDKPRWLGLNFYYLQEELLFEVARKGSFGWTVHRSPSMIGHARQRHEHGRQAGGGLSGQKQPDGKPELAADWTRQNWQSATGSA